MRPRNGVAKPSNHSPYTSTMHTHNQAHSAPVTGLHAAIVEAGTDAMQAADVVATANMATA